MPTAREMKPVREVFREDVLPRLEKLEESLLDLTSIKTTLTEQGKTISTIEQSLEFTDRQVREMKDNIIPAVKTEMSKLVTNICMKSLDSDTHRRKWSLIIDGIKGNTGEPETVTRDKLRTFAVQQLKVQGADAHNLVHVTVCHKMQMQELFYDL